MTRVNSLVPLMYHDPYDLGSLILTQITLKERALRIVGLECRDLCLHAVRFHRNLLCIMSKILALVLKIISIYMAKKVLKNKNTERLRH